MSRSRTGSARFASPLREAGNGAFAAIQEVVAELERDPATDWSRVDLEALRRHLADMRNFTLHVEVIDRQPVPGGVRLRVRGTDAEAQRSLERALADHPAALRRETGWEMRVSAAAGVFEIQVTSSRPEDVPKIRGLGYIGVMATGAHHAAHHLAIARGAASHAHH